MKEVLVVLFNEVSDPWIRYPLFTYLLVWSGLHFLVDFDRLRRRFPSVADLSRTIGRASKVSLVAIVPLSALSLFGPAIRDYLTFRSEPALGETSPGLLPDWVKDMGDAKESEKCTRAMLIAVKIINGFGAQALEKQSQLFITDKIKVPEGIKNTDDIPADLEKRMTGEQADFIKHSLAPINEVAFAWLTIAECLKRQKNDKAKSAYLCTAKFSAARVYDKRGDEGPSFWEPAWVAMAELRWTYRYAEPEQAVQQAVCELELLQ